MCCRSLQNVLANPNRDKYRRIRKRQFQQRVGNVSEAWEALRLVGFEDAVERGEDVLLLKPEQDLQPVKRAWSAVKVALKHV